MLFLLSGCASTGGEQTVVPAGQTIVFVNDSRFPVTLRKGEYGGPVACVLAPLDRAEYHTTSDEREIVFYPVYEVPLTESVSSSLPAPASTSTLIVLQGQIDKSVFLQRALSDKTGELHVPQPGRFENEAVYLVLENKSANGASVHPRDGNTFLTLFSGRGDTINAGEVGVFESSSRTLGTPSIYHPSVAFPSIVYRPGFRYTYTFDGSRVALVDARALHAVGERSAVRVLPALPEMVDPAIEAGLPRVAPGGYRVINALAPREDKDGVFLAVGASDERGGFGRQAKAYICEAAETGPDRYTVRWELGPGDLDEALGPARSAWYDTKHGVYRVLGERLGDGLPASYVIELDEAGKHTRPALAVRASVLAKITGDPAGSFYLAGEAVEAERSTALLVKYDGEGGAVWKAQPPFPRNSYYQDMLFDEDQNQIVAAGVQNGQTGAGDGGTPFIQGIDAETGAMLWQSDLTSAPLRGTALACRIEKVPAYGYRVVLCGISGGNTAPPYLEATVTVRGRFVP
jgi:hypothetical protein